MLHIARSLVDAPDAAHIVASEQDDCTVLELKVAKEDLGKVIGKQGRTARAIRSLLAAAGERASEKVRLEIVE